MHAYVITAKPSRWQRCMRSVGRQVPRFLVGLGMVALGLVVFAVRSIRAVSNLIAYHAARIEFWAAARTGRAPVGQTIGVGVAAAFVAEFHRARTTETAA